VIREVAEDSPRDEWGLALWTVFDAPSLYFIPRVGGVIRRDLLRGIECDQPATFTSYNAAYNYRHYHKDELGSYEIVNITDIRRKIAGQRRMFSDRFLKKP